MPKDLTPQEKNIVQYHRDNVTFNNVGRDEEVRLYPAVDWQDGRFRYRRDFGCVG